MVYKELGVVLELEKVRELVVGRVLLGGRDVVFLPGQKEPEIGRRIPEIESRWSAGRPATAEPPAGAAEFPAEAAGPGRAGHKISWGEEPPRVARQHTWHGPAGPQVLPSGLRGCLSLSKPSMDALSGGALEPCGRFLCIAGTCGRAPAPPTRPATLAASTSPRCRWPPGSPGVPPRALACFPRYPLQASHTFDPLNIIPPLTFPYIGPTLYRTNLRMT
jgi:hypothetical protein